MKKKVTVCLLFGGKSGEHEVSLQSAQSIYEALDKKKYHVLLVGIDKTGKWLLGNASNYLLNTHNPKLIALNKSSTSPVTAIATPLETQLMSLQTGKEIQKIDVFFPIVHGTYGEDGCLQGFLELLDAAYVGAEVLGSAVGMDKDIMKRLLRDANIPTAKFVSLTKNNAIKSNIQKAIKYVGGYPLFIKPANLGSSVGISKVHNKKELSSAINKAFLYDTKILIEEYVRGREIEVSVLGNEKPIASLPGEIIPQYEFYSYEAKYIDENGAQFIIPSRLTKSQIKSIQRIAIKTFQTLNCTGMARVDFFFTSKGKFIVNEINTLPGFTKISMYPKLWEASGISYTSLLDNLIMLAFKRKAKKRKIVRSYSF